MAKCPYCAYVTPEPDDGDSFVRGWQEVAHMETEHPDILTERLRKLGIIDMTERFREDDK